MQNGETLTGTLSLEPAEDPARGAARWEMPEATLGALVDQCGEVDAEGLSRCGMRVPDPDAEFGSGRWEFHEQPVAELSYGGRLGGITAVEGYEQGAGPTATVTYRTSSLAAEPGAELTMDVEYVISGDVDIDEQGELVTELYMGARPVGS